MNTIDQNRTAGIPNMRDVKKPENNLASGTDKTTQPKRLDPAAIGKQVLGVLVHK